MSEYHLFEFNDEIIAGFKEKKEIPVHFYNKDGQILIYKKEGAEDAEIDRLLKFVEQGIFYHTRDRDALGLGDGEKKMFEETEDGLIDIKLLSEEAAEILTETTTDLFEEVQTQTIDAVKLATSGKAIQRVFLDFESQPEAMSGLVNIIELMAGKNATVDVEMAVKRTVVVMAMKTRGMNSATVRDQAHMTDQVQIIMMSSLLCDLGYTRMKMPESKELEANQYEYIKNHPLMSYLMLAHEELIDDRVKRNILLHHHPVKSTLLNNNYPNLKPLMQKLIQLEEKYRDDESKKPIAIDIKKQLLLLKKELPYDEDANILAIASEFASLTSETSWRPAFTTDRAIKMIVNNSFFTYTARIVREFLDHVSMNLNENKKIINIGDYVIVAAKGLEKTFFEVCQVTSSNRYQSRPGIDRFATIYPDIGKAPRMCFLNFNLDKLRLDPRFAHYELSNDDSRHIVYIVDPQYDEELYAKLSDLTLGRKKYVGNKT